MPETGGIEAQSPKKNLGAKGQGPDPGEEVAIMSRNLEIAHYTNQIEESLV